MSKIKLLYFKPSGKWGYEGELEWVDHSSMFSLREHVKNLTATNNLPGLSSGSWEGPIYIDASEHPLGFPQLII